MDTKAFLYTFFQTSIGGFCGYTMGKYTERYKVNKSKYLLQLGLFIRSPKMLEMLKKTQK